MKHLTHWSFRVQTIISLQLNNLWESDTALWFVIYGLAGLSVWVALYLLSTPNYFPI